MKIRPKSSGVENKVEFMNSPKFFLKYFKIKEKLYDERIHLRNIINSLKEENRLIRTKILTTEVPSLEIFF
jgi:hypothetical protein